MRQTRTIHTGDEKDELNRSETLRQPLASEPRVIKLLHRRAAEIQHRLRLIKSSLEDNRERLLLDYILINTLGRSKASDQISNSQFTSGKSCQTTGQVIDYGCGLKSINTVRRARQALIAKGIIFGEAVHDSRGASTANRYGLVFIQEFLAEQQQARHSDLRQDTPGGYQSLTPTIKFPSGINKQRCIASKNKKKSTAKKHHMHPEHVDYLIEQIEQVTGDRHSRAAFAQIALTVAEGRIMQVLSILKDRDNIRNKGAWFWSVCQQYRERRVHQADKSQPSRRSQNMSRTELSVKDWLVQHKPDLLRKLSYPRDLEANTDRYRTLEVFKKRLLQAHNPP